MVKNENKLFARVFPGDNSELDCLFVHPDKKKVRVRSVRDYVNDQNKETHWEFETSGVFTEECQSEIYSRVTEGIINSVIKGRNALVLAFGQNGTGKTYTMTGLLHRFEWRGIAPRIVQDFYTHPKIQEMSLAVTFVEFCGDKCKDLLRNVYIDQRKSIPKKVIKSPNEGLNLIFLGEVNRHRVGQGSNCGSSVFTIHVTPINSTIAGGNTQLHLIDAVGFEGCWSSVLNHPSQRKNERLTFVYDKSSSWANYMSRAVTSPHSINESSLKNSPLVHFIRKSLPPNGIMRLIGHLNRAPEAIRYTLASLRFGTSFFSIVPREVILAAKPNLLLVTKALQEEIKDVRNEMALGDLLRGKFPPLSTKDMYEEVLHSLIRSYLLNEGNVTAENLLLTTHPMKLLQVFRQVYRTIMFEYESMYVIPSEDKVGITQTGSVTTLSRRSQSSLQAEATKRYSASIAEALIQGKENRKPLYEEFLKRNPEIPMRLNAVMSSLESAEKGKNNDVETVEGLRKNLETVENKLKKAIWARSHIPQTDKIAPNGQMMLLNEEIDAKEEENNIKADLHKALENLKVSYNMYITAVKRFNEFCYNIESSFTEYINLLYSNYLVIPSQEDYVPEPEKSTVMERDSRVVSESENLYRALQIQYLSPGT